MQIAEYVRGRQRIVEHVGSAHKVMDPRVFRQANCLGSANGWDPVVVPVELVDDPPALGRRKHKFLTGLAGNQRDQQLHESRIRANGALAGASLRGANVKLRLPVPFQALFMRAVGGLESKSTSATVSAVAYPNRVPVMTGVTRKSWTVDQAACAG